MPDYIFMLESRLTPAQLRVLNQVQQEAQDAGLNLYLVGGAVRDLMTGAPIRDLDFVVEGNPLRLVRSLAGEKPRRVNVEEGRRSAELILADGISFSLEMARTESFRHPGRPSEARPTPILQDLQRRDFTLNAMGISLTPGSRGLLLDPTNGLADIERRELRALSNQSFYQDPVRMLRLVRFSTRLGFHPEPRTADQFAAALESRAQDSIPGEALRRELEQVTRELNAVAVLKAWEEHELLEVLHPQLQKRRPDYDGSAKLQKYILQAQGAGYALDPFYLVLHYLLKRLKPRPRNAILRTLGLTKAEKKQALGLEAEAQKLVRMLRSRRAATPREVYQLLTPIRLELLIFTLAAYSKQKGVQVKIYNYLFKYRPLRNKLPVRELHLLGVPAGPKFDQILEKYFAAQLDGKIRGRPAELNYLRKLAGLPPPAKEKKRKKKEAAAAEAAPVEAPRGPKKVTPAAAVPAAPRLEKKKKPAPRAAPRPARRRGRSGSRAAPGKKRRRR